MDTTLQRAGSVKFAPITAVNRRSETRIPRDVERVVGSGTPSLWIGFTAIGLVVWSLVEAGSQSTLFGLAGLTGLAAATWMIGFTFYKSPAARGLVIREALFATGVAALASAAVVAGTPLSPFVMLIPVAVGFTVATIGESRYADIALLTGLIGITALGMRSIVWLDSPIAPTALYLASAGCMTVAAYVLADRLNVRMAEQSFYRVRTAAPTPLPHELTERLNDADSPIAMARVAADILCESARPTYLGIVEQVPDTAIIRPLVERGTLDFEVDGLRSGLAGLSHDTVSRNEPRVVINDGSNLDSVLCRRLGVEALVIVPLQRMGTRLGAIHMAWVELASFDQVDQALDLALKLAPWITPDIAISRVAGEMERGYVNAISAVCASLDEQSEFTRGHSRRVARIALEIAELMPLSDYEQRQLLYAAEMHDVGRIGIGHEILEKPSALSDDEWSVVQTIPTRGAGIVEPVSYFGEVGASIRHLRERWDGQGYPDSLAGEDIPLLSRIVAVAEAYDAMTSERPYRKAMSAGDALRQLWSERGQKFDPGIVEAFVTHRAPAVRASL